MSKMVRVTWAGKQFSDSEKFYQISYDRWENAKKALDNDDYFAAAYLSGYSAECLLKYVIWAKLNKQDNLTGKTNEELEKQYENLRCLWSHRLDQMIEFANTENVFKAPTKSDFKNLIKWNAQWRYAIRHNFTDIEITKAFLKEIVDLSVQLKDNTGLKIETFQL